MSIKTVKPKSTMLNSNHLDLLVTVCGDTRLIQDRDGALYIMNVADPQSRPPGAPKLLMVFDINEGVLELWNHTYRRTESFIDLTETMALCCELQPSPKDD
jgi:hypothetical protein